MRASGDGGAKGPARCGVSKRPRWRNDETFSSHVDLLQHGHDETCQLWALDKSRRTAKIQLLQLPTLLLWGRDVLIANQEGEWWDRRKLPDEKQSWCFLEDVFSSADPGHKKWPEEKRLLIITDPR